MSAKGGGTITLMFLPLISVFDHPKIFWTVCKQEAACSNKHDSA
jgi:hypothetical protein